MTTPFIWPEINILTSEIDIRAQVNQCLLERGHFAFLRKSRPRRAPSYIDTRREALEDDEFNIGTGQLYDDYLLKIRKMPAASLQTSPGREIRADLGLMAPRTYVIFLGHPPIPECPDLIPSISDQIIEVSLAEDGCPKLAYNIERIYDIQQTHDYRDQGGRIEYWSLVAVQRVLGK